MIHCFNDCKIEKGTEYWYIFPNYLNIRIENFTLQLTKSNTIEEAHEKIGKIVGYNINLNTNCPTLKSKEDAEKVIRFFTDFDPLFE